MKENQVQFLPFNAINEFMLDDYKKKVIQKVLSDIQLLPSEKRASLNQMIKRLVSVPGFRNSTQAPTGIKVVGALRAFNKSQEFTAAILSAWSDLNSDLRINVFELLQQRDWELLPIDADRTKLPGFLTKWPESETYDMINQAYKDSFSKDQNSSDDDVRLMTVWISGRLPAEMADPNQ